MILDREDDHRRGHAAEDRLGKRFASDPSRLSAGSNPLLLSPTVTACCASSASPPSACPTNTDDWAAAVITVEGGRCCIRPRRAMPGQFMIAWVATAPAAPRPPGKPVGSGRRRRAAILTRARAADAA